MYRRVTANLALRQVEKSAVIDIALSLSREIEEEIYMGYASTFYWERSLVSANAAQGEWLPESNASTAGQTEADWHLRGMAAIKGFGVERVDDDISHVENFGSIRRIGPFVTSWFTPVPGGPARKC